MSVDIAGKDAASRVRARFEELLVEPLDSNTRLKRGVKQRLSDLGPEHASMQLAGSALSKLLDGLARKTSPLHVRMVHAAGRLYQELDDDSDATELVRVVNETADMIRRPDLKTSVPTS